VCSILSSSSRASGCNDLDRDSRSSHILHHGFDSEALLATAGIFQKSTLACRCFCMTIRREEPPQATNPTDENTPPLRLRAWGFRFRRTDQCQHALRTWPQPWTRFRPHKNLSSQSTINSSPSLTRALDWILPKKAGPGTASRRHQRAISYSAPEDKSVLRGRIRWLR